MEYRQIGAWTLALESQSGADDRTAWRILRSPGSAHLVEFSTMTQSSEPPYTCSVCTVVWEEGHREMSPYPDYAPE